MTTASDSHKIIGGNAANMMLTFKREGANMLPGFTPGPELSALFEKYKILFHNQLKVLCCLVSVLVVAS
jgi:hypothetical protein